MWLDMARYVIHTMPPNIIYLHSHDTGRMISPYGAAVNTPNLHRFAEQGVVFRQAFAAAPTCSPSRAALLTSMMPHQAGMLGLAHRGFSLLDYRKTWLSVFRRAGLRTVLAGLEHVGLRERIGRDDGPALDIDLGPARMDIQRVVPSACRWLESDQAREPFFMDIGVFETHRTPRRGWPEQWHNEDDSPLGDPRWVRPPCILPDTAQAREDFADFMASVERLDAAWGQVLDVLASRGLDRNTIVIITTDHGIAFPGMKCSLTDHGTGVLLMMRGPEDTPLGGGKVVDSMVMQTDVLPTLCDLLGVDRPRWANGRSMLGLLDGSLDADTSDSLHDAIFGEVTYHAAYQPMRGIRTARHKLIRRFYHQPLAIPANCDDSVSKNQWIADGGLDRPEPRIELFDLAADPAERCNLAESPRHRAIRSDLESRLADWMARTDDPLLLGPVPLPEGGQVNATGNLSPNEPPMTGDAFDPSVV